MSAFVVLLGRSWRCWEEQGSHGNCCFEVRKEGTFIPFIRSFVSGKLRRISRGCIFAASAMSGLSSESKECLVTKNRLNDICYRIFTL